MTLLDAMVPDWTAGEIKRSARSQGEGLAAVPSPAPALVTPGRTHSLSSGDDRQEEIRVVAPAGVDQVQALVLQVLVPLGEQALFVAVDVVTLDHHPERLACAEHGAGRPDLDVDGNDFTLVKELVLLVSVLGLVRR
jgi:hypothetical protein